MTFEGIGMVWNPKTKKVLCNFNKGEYSTNDLYEINILKECPQATLISGDMPEEPEKKTYSEKKTKKQLIEEAKALGITGSDRMKAAEIEEAIKAEL